VKKILECFLRASSRDFLNRYIIILRTICIKIVSIFFNSPINFVYLVPTLKSHSRFLYLASELNTGWLYLDNNQLNKLLEVFFFKSGGDALNT